MKFPLIELNVGRFSRLASWLLQADCDGDKGRNLTNGSLAAPSGRWRQGAVCDLRANCHQLPHFSPHTHTHTHTGTGCVKSIYFIGKKKYPKKKRQISAFDPHTVGWEGGGGPAYCHPFAALTDWAEGWGGPTKKKGAKYCTQTIH